MDGLNLPGLAGLALGTACAGRCSTSARSGWRTGGGLQAGWQPGAALKGRRERGLTGSGAAGGKQKKRKEDRQGQQGGCTTMHPTDGLQTPVCVFPAPRTAVAPTCQHWAAPLFIVRRRGRVVGNWQGRRAADASISPECEGAGAGERVRVRMQEGSEQPVPRCCCCCFCFCCCCC